MKPLRLVMIIVLSLVALAVAGVAAISLVLFAPVSTVGEVEFERDPAVPPLAESRLLADGTRAFELTAQEGTTGLLQGRPTDTWGYNGSYLEPTLRAERREDVRMRVRNRLDRHGLLPPGHSVRLALRFTDYADPDTPYMFHCHLLQHESTGASAR